MYGYTSDKIVTHGYAQILLHMLRIWNMDFKLRYMMYKERLLISEKILYIRIYMQAQCYTGNLYSWWRSDFFDCFALRDFNYTARSLQLPRNCRKIACANTYSCCACNQLHTNCINYTEIESPLIRTVVARLEKYRLFAMILGLDNVNCGHLS